MGTRNITAVKLNDEYKIAQYGQWDGYPDGQGKTVLNFLHNHDPEKFKSKIDKLSFLTAEDIEDIDEQEDWSTLSHLSRDRGAEILELVLNGNIEKLHNQIDFMDDSSCEWAYVIDYDKNILEVFAYNDSLKVYDLDTLPDEEEFCKELYRIRSIRRGDE